jgi:hypothetical protein
LAFWQGLAEMTGGVYLTLDQFNEIRDTLMAICYHHSGASKLMFALKDELMTQRKMTRAMAQTGDGILLRLHVEESPASVTSTSGERMVATAGEFFGK